VEKASTLLLFGATGDLARRMLLPSLYGLDSDGLLPADLRIIGTARTQLDDAAFRERADAALHEYLPDGFYSGDVAKRFLARLHYVSVDIKDAGGFARLAEAVGDPCNGVAIFLSTAPSLFKPTIDGLEEAGRIDHYLGKETVQNLIALRFANLLFEPLWNAAHIDHVQITVAETIGLEGRGDYYDQAGALRDMVQNHMLQLLALVAMEPPTDFNATAVRDEKVKVLRALRPITAADAETNSVIGQYTRGAIDGQPVPGYSEEIGHDSNTETFVALKAHVDNWRWKGVPFYLRTGKRMPDRDTEIFIQFKDVPFSIFASRGATTRPNKLIIGLQPQESIELRLMAKTPGLDRQGVRLREIPLDLGLANAFSEYRRRIAYERLLLDLIEGDPTLFVRRDEVEAQWAWIDRIRAAWAEKGITPRPYAAGNWGPSAAIALTERDGISWHE
jgi:glucose-6-phosphate 1-dehydrogenase